MKAFLALCAVALVWSAAAAGSSVHLAPPSGLHAFVYRADEPVKADHTYALMPAFAWNPVQGASSYELQMATSRAFADATTIFDSKFASPVASVQKAVPWMTGHPYALWVRVRVTAKGNTSGWSAPFGFNTAWQEVPQQQPAPEGLIRWTPVQGATGYQVWFLNVPGGWTVQFPTLTNVADEREYWTLHPGMAGTIRWRVRATRLITDPSLPNGIQVVAHGPYSPVFTTQVSGRALSGPLAAVAAESDTSSTPSAVAPHQLTPGFTWSGATDALGDTARSNLFRVYVFSDKECVNPVLTGSIVGGPAWAPRNGDPLALPQDSKALADAIAGKFSGWGSQGNVFTADAETPAPSESASVPGSSSSGSSTPSAPSAPSGSFTTAGGNRLVSLPDNGWPQGRYWWTVVPVQIVDVPPPASSSPPAGSGSGAAAVDKIEYHDLAVPQDLCAAGQVWPFGMQSAPVTTKSQTPYASGLAESSRVVSAASKKPAFQLLPVVTWTPALAADTYEVQLSKRVYPWSPVKKLTSVVPSAVLPLDKSDLGTWYYRVRGVNPNLVGPAQKLAWSKPVAIRISGDRFRLVK